MNKFELSNIDLYTKKINLWIDKIITKYPVKNTFENNNIHNFEFVYVNREWLIGNFRHGRLDACIVRDKVNKSIQYLIFKYPDIDYAKKNSDTDSEFNKIMSGHTFTKIINKPDKNNILIESIKIPLNNDFYIPINVIDRIFNEKYFIKLRDKYYSTSKNNMIEISKNENSEIVWFSDKNLGDHLTIYDYKTNKKVLQIKKRGILTYLINYIFQGNLFKAYLTFDEIDINIPLSIALIIGFESILNYYK